MRYSKDQLLDIFKVQQEKASPNLDDLFIDGWHPHGANGKSNGHWGKSEERRESNGPEICWDHDGSVQPLGLTPMSDEEREVTLLEGHVNARLLIFARFSLPRSIHPSNPLSKTKMARQTLLASTDEPPLPRTAQIVHHHVRAAVNGEILAIFYSQTIPSRLPLPTIAFRKTKPQSLHLRLPFSAARQITKIHLDLVLRKKTMILADQP